MARINGPVWKVSRRLGFSVLETGEELQKKNLCSWSAWTNEESKTD